MGDRRADPLLVDVRRSLRDAILDDRRKRAPDRPVVLRLTNDLGDHRDDSFRCGRMWSEDPDPVGNQLAGGDVDNSTLDASAADVDPEAMLGDHLLRLKVVVK